METIETLPAETAGQDMAQASPGNALALLVNDPEKLRDFPVDVLERLFALNETNEANVAKRAYSVAFNAVQASLAAVEVIRRGSNEHTRSRYAKLNDIQEVLDPLLSEHGFSQSMSMAPGAPDGMSRFVLTIRHSAGHSESHYLDAPIDDVGIKGNQTKTKLHGMASSQTYCRRQLIKNVWNIRERDPSKDDDGNAAAMGPAVQPISAAQRKTIEDLIEESNSDKIKFCEMLRVKSLAEIPVAAYPAARAALKSKIQLVESAGKETPDV